MDKTDKPTLKHLFPKDFFWGTSTSAHQVEGGTVNQWSVWELAQAAELAKTSKQRDSKTPLWDEIKVESQNPANYVSGEGVDHYNRYEADLDIVKAMNLNAFRFGIEWSRIEPEEGVWDEDAIEHYRHYIKALRKRGIEPFMNLWHYTNPIWFEEKGGFAKRSNLPYFERFVAKVADTLLEDVTYVLTINEANVYASFSYILGAWPPQQKNPLKGLWVYQNLLVAHKRAYQILKREHPDLQVGVAHNVGLSLPTSRKNPLEVIIAWGSDVFWQWWFFDRIMHYQDFVGMNYYYTNYIKNYKIQNPTTPASDMGFYMEPDRLYELLMRAAKSYQKPIMITETGVADRHDQYRQWWIEQTTAAMERAIRDGADVKGYFLWSLLDNFEWASGWWPKFGLISVDREHGMKRRPRSSAKWLAAYLKRVRK